MLPKSQTIVILRFKYDNCQRTDRDRETRAILRCKVIDSLALWLVKGLGVSNKESQLMLILSCCLITS
jgi:hypothetical protein